MVWLCWLLKGGFIRANHCVRDVRNSTRSSRLRHFSHLIYLDIFCWRTLKQNNAHKGRASNLLVYSPCLSQAWNQMMRHKNSTHRLFFPQEPENWKHGQNTQGRLFYGSSAWKRAIDSKISSCLKMGKKSYCCFFRLLLLLLLFHNSLLWKKVIRCKISTCPKMEKVTLLFFFGGHKIESPKPTRNM